MQRERKSDGNRAQHDNEAPVDEEVEHSMVLEKGEEEGDNVRDRVADNDVECAHAPKGERELKERDGASAESAKAVVHDVDVAVAPA